MKKKISDKYDIRPFLFKKLKRNWFYQYKLENRETHRLTEEKFFFLAKVIDMLTHMNTCYASFWLYSIYIYNLNTFTFTTTWLSFNSLWNHLENIVTCVPLNFSTHFKTFFNYMLTSVAFDLCLVFTWEKRARNKRRWEKLK